MTNDAMTKECSMTNASMALDVIEPLFGHSLDLGPWAMFT